MVKIKLTKLKCEKCGFIWHPRKEDVRVCPKCHSPWWDQEKKEKKNGI